MIFSGLIGSIILGQIVSLMDTISVLCVKLFASKTDVQFPILQYVITYFFTCVIAIILYLLDRRKLQKTTDNKLLSISSSIKPQEGIHRIHHHESTFLSIPCCNDCFKLTKNSVIDTIPAGWKVSLGNPRILAENGLITDLESDRISPGDSAIGELSTIEDHNNHIELSWCSSTLDLSLSPWSIPIDSNTNCNENLVMTTPVKSLKGLFKGGYSSDVSTSPSESTGRISPPPFSVDYYSLNGNNRDDAINNINSMMTELSPLQKQGQSRLY